jgi:hypothetical protein
MAALAKPGGRRKASQFVGNKDGDWRPGLRARKNRASLENQPRNPAAERRLNSMTVASAAVSKSVGTPALKRLSNPRWKFDLFRVCMHQRFGILRRNGLCRSAKTITDKSYLSA